VKLEANGHRYYEKRRGVFAEVWCIDNFAVKIVPANLYVRERQIIPCEHPSVVAIWSHGIWDGRGFFVMPRLKPCLFLSSWNYHRLRDGLHYIHNLGFSHGDVKPGNIMQDDDGKAYWIDFNSICKATPATMDDDFLALEAIFNS
jgi:serine/threonine protein kinase